MINGQKMNAVAFHIQRIPDYQTFSMTTKSFQTYQDQSRSIGGCNSSMVMSWGGLLHCLSDFIVANVQWFSGPLQWGQDRVCSVREMSMMISIRRGKGRSLDAYSTAHWLKSVNNKTTQ